MRSPTRTDRLRSSPDSRWMWHRLRTWYLNLPFKNSLLISRPLLHMLDKDFDAGWYFWINRAEPNTKYSSLPPLSESSDEITILRWYGVYLEKDPSCPACGDFQGVLREQYGVEAGMGDVPVRSGFREV